MIFLFVLILVLVLIVSYLILVTLAVLNIGIRVVRWHLLVEYLYNALTLKVFTPPLASKHWIKYAKYINYFNFSSSLDCIL